MTAKTAVDYAASRLFSAPVEDRSNASKNRSATAGRTSNEGAPLAVFDLGQRVPVPMLKKPMRADALVAMQSVIEQCHAMNTAAALIVRLIRDNDLPFIPRGIETARFALGDLLHNVDEAMHAHRSVMDRG